MNLDTIISHISKLDVENTRTLISCAKLHLITMKEQAKPIIENEFINTYNPLIEKVNEHLGINIKYPSRKREFTFPRYILSDYLFRKYIEINSEKKSYETVGKLLNKDRTTIICAVDVHRAEMKAKQPYYIDLYNRVYQIIAEFEKHNKD